MSKKKEPATITMTEEQLERVITKAVRTAIRASKDKDKLPGNEVDELKAAPASFSLISIFTIVLLIIICAFSAISAIACIKFMIQNGFSFNWLMMTLFFAFISVASIISYKEILNVKKLEVLNTIFSAITTVSNLIIAIVGAYFAYKALK